MDEQVQRVVNWVKEHRRDILIAAGAALITAKFLPRKNVAYIQDADGKAFWVMPTKQ